MVSTSIFSLKIISFEFDESVKGEKFKDFAIRKFVFLLQASTQAKRTNFISKAVTYLRSHGYDGLDLVWQYPALGDSPAEDKQRYTLLCEEIRSAFDAESAASGKPRLLLTAAVASSDATISAGYEVDRLSR